MPMLMLKCKSCGREFPSGLDFSKEAFETSKLENNTHQCPFCKHSDVYNKPDYYFLST